MPTEPLTVDAAGNAAHAVSVLEKLGVRLSPGAQEALIAGIILAGFLLLAVLVRLALRAALARLAARTTWGGRLVQGVQAPVTAWILVTGITSALLSVDAVAPARAVILRVYGAVMLVVAIAAGMRLVAVAIDWSFSRLTARIGDTATHYAALSRKVITVLVWAIGGVVILGQLGVEITPLITTLGLGSLAVALALQDTLANFFAGIYLMLDRPIKVGDFVRLDTGDEGFVDAIGWRSTHVRLWSNYIVVVPNARLTNSIITNLVLNQSETSVYIRGGVGYLSDLDHVERVLQQTAHEVMSRVEGACLDAEPLVRYQEFGDSNITFLLILKVTYFTYQYALKHEVIKAVHRRFREEGIEISWPVRQLVAPHPIPVRVEASRDGEGGNAVPVADSNGGTIGARDL